MKHRWLYNALTVLFLVAGLFGSFTNTPVANAAVPESNATDKIEPALLEKFNLDGMADFIVRFTEQADLSAAQNMGWTARGQYVYDTLKETAARTQAQAKGMLDAAGLEYTTFIGGNDLYVKNGTLAVATDLAGLDAVYYIRATRTYYIDPITIENPMAKVSWGGDLLAQNLNANLNSPDALAWGITYTKADQFWTAFGVQGDGIKVANIDTGVQWDHPALDQAFACGTDPSDPACWEDPSNVCGGSACDNNGHGTHTMGTMVADDDPSLTWQAGMAPNSTWIACKGCESNSCSDTALLGCGDWVLAPDSDPANRPNVVNNSWGGTPDGDDWYLATVNAWRAAGIFPAFSAGNAGPTCGSLGDPGSYEQTFASGMVNSSGVIDPGSSRGPSAFGDFTKPNIAAPGVSVCSTIPTNAWSCGYTGTSMASPHSAGAVALLWSCNPGLVGDIDGTVAALQDTAGTAPDGSCGVSPWGGNYTYGHGYLDVLAAGITVCGGVETGTLEGYVYDNVGNPIEGANVEALGTLNAAGIEATTDPTGYYTMDLVVGIYDVTASKLNYTSETQTGIEVIADTVTTLDPFTLTFLGAWTQLPLDASCPDWTRYDAEYSDGTGLVYILGGRTGTDTFGDIYAYDPATNTCADTGTDMVDAVSNYTVVPLNVGGADVLCTFGGRNAAGGYTQVGQCYDPIANTISQVTTLPTTYATYMPGAAVAVDNMAYIYGGFQNAAAPYETAETWQWDPATDTWTQQGDLVYAMSYIQSAVVDGLIYGFGGTMFDGTNLNAQVYTQLFDPTSGTWDDAAIADLPTAGAEGRAYGFSAGSSYELAGKIVVAGGGQWPNDTYVVYAYDIATDTYDDAFPDLNISRRNQAGFFLPATASDPGMMFVIGGRSSAAGYGGDNPPYAPPEYYPVLKVEPTIAVDPEFLDELVITDTTKTVTLDVMNVGGGTLDWTITEVPGLKTFEKVTFPAATAPEGSQTRGATVPERSFSVPVSKAWSAPAGASGKPATAVNQPANVTRDPAVVFTPPQVTSEVLFDQQPNQANGIFSDASCDICAGAQILAENFVLEDVGTIEQVVLWTGYYSTDTPIDPDHLRVIIHQDAAGLPGTVVYDESDVAYTRAQTGVILFGVHEWMHTLTLATPASLPAGNYWIEIYNDTGFGTDDMFWEVGNADTYGRGIVGSGYAFEAPGSAWNYDAEQDLSMQLIGTIGVDVLLVAADDDVDPGYGSPIEAMLEAFGDLGAVDLFDAINGTPTLAELQAYDVVVTWNDYDYYDATAMGNVLADYVDAGGKVIDTQFALNPWGMAGRFVTEEYTAIHATANAYVDTCMGTYDPAHPIMAGVTTICDYYYGTGTTLAPGSTAIAYYTDGEVLAAVKDSIPVVTLNVYPGYYYEWTGQVDVMLHNAILWLAGIETDVPWLSEDPTSGTNNVPVAVTFDPTGMAYGEYYATLKIDSNDAANPTIYVPVTMTIVDELPEIVVDPLAFDVTVFSDETAVEDLNISNVGIGTLDWLIKEIPGIKNVTSPAAQPSAARSGQPVELSVSNGVAPESAGTNWQTTGDISLILDDGSRDNDIGLGGTIEMLFVNRFTPDAGSFPFYIDQVSIYFSSVGLVNVGDDIEIVLYENTTGNEDPAVGSNFLASFPATVQVLDDWSNYTLASPVTFNGPGDAIIGAIALELPGTSYWPASMDQTLSYERSWAGWWNASPPPTPPLLPPDNWTLIDAYFAGNWMVRASGQTTDMDIPWLSEDPTSGQDDATVAVTFDPTGLADGQYFGTLAVESDDPINPVVYVPVTMTVVTKAAGVLLTPETDALADDPGATVVYTLTLENTGNIADTFTVEADGVWDVNLPVTSFDLGAGETADVVVEVTIPAGAMAGDNDLTTVTATSAFDSGVSDFSELTTTANQIFSIEVAPATAALSGAPGDVVTYTLTVTNTGNGEDSIALSLAGNGWTTELPVTSIDDLAAGASAEVTVLVTIPTDALDGDFDVVTVTATSQGGPTATAELTTTAVVVTPEGYFVQLPIVFK